MLRGFVFDSLRIINRWCRCLQGLAARTRGLLVNIPVCSHNSSQLILLTFRADSFARPRRVDPKPNQIQSSFAPEDSSRITTRCGPQRLSGSRSSVASSRCRDSRAGSRRRRGAHGLSPCRSFVSFPVPRREVP
jgi:hypothetical protein